MFLAMLRPYAVACDQGVVIDLFVFIITSILMVSKKQSTGPALPNQFISLAMPLPAMLSLHSTLYPVISMST